MSASSASLAFDWHAPVPQLFTRSDGPTFWPGDRRCRPRDLQFRTFRDLRLLTVGMPPDLKDSLRERFKPTRGPLRWDTPPALPTNVRERYEPEGLRKSSERWVCAQITLTAEMIERLLNAPEGMVGGLTHNYLLVMQMLRLRQLWEEVQRRDWPEDHVTVFTRALG